MGAVSVVLVLLALMVAVAYHGCCQRRRKWTDVKYWTLDGKDRNREDGC